MSLIVKGVKNMDEIYLAHSKKVYKYLLSLCNNQDIAEELTQETFYKAIKGIKKFRNDCSVNVWLCRIAKNTWIDYIKKEKQITLISIDNELENYIIENDIDNKDEMLDLYKQIHKLDEKTKEVFILRIKGELSFKEIGNILGQTEVWARITFYRGKMKLKEELK
ncbi:MAG: sigma-70 family RNA polymerase sigma factor [Clostridia bacterium]|nr:sigma-70 family RNA polymerase sigma factor [Clostridia bacterium]